MVFFESLKKILAFVLADRAAKDAEIAELKAKLAIELANNPAEQAAIDAAKSEAAIKTLEAEAAKTKAAELESQLSSVVDAEAVLSEFVRLIGYSESSPE